MKIIKREIAFEGKYLQFVRKHFKTTMGEEGIWETVERKNIHGEGAVVIIPLTKERELILERNWRAPLESFVIQFPAGLSDREGEGEEAHPNYFGATMPNFNSHRSNAFFRSRS